MRHLRSLLIVLFVSLFFLGSLAATPVVHAGTDYGMLFDLMGKNKTGADLGKEFCDKRAGDLMNLETWFSGKCGPDINTLSGEGVGFIDIVTLQGMETINGPTQKGLKDQLIDLLKTFQELISVAKLNDPQLLAEKYAEFGKDNDSGGLLAASINTTTTLIRTKPAGTYDYINYVAQNLQQKHIVKSTLAAAPGYGYTSLAPILPIWRAFRNISYLLFSLVFVIYGIMIMFRIRIDSKTAASIQLAIPKIVTTLLIITFSYAIVGLLVDLMTVITGLAISLLGAGGVLDLSAGRGLINLVGGTSVLGGFGSFLINNTIAIVVAPLIIMSFIFAPMAHVTGVLLGLAGLTGFGFIIGIIITIAVIIAYAKLILKLFQAFLAIIIQLIFAPLFLMANVLPGSNAISNWIMTLIGNLAVFPTAVFFLVLSYALMFQPIYGILNSILSIPFLAGLINYTKADLSAITRIRDLSTQGAVWAPPMTFGFSAGIEGDILLATIGFGLLLMAPKYVDMVHDALKTPPFKYGAAIGEALKTGVNIQDKWANSGYKSPSKGLTNYLQTTPGAKVKPAVDAFTQATGS